MFYNACVQSSPRGVLSPPLLHNISHHLDITHLHLLPRLPRLVVVVDGEDPETPAVVLLVVPHTALSAGRVTVCSYHRLRRVGRLEIIGHGPDEMNYIV